MRINEPPGQHQLSGTSICIGNPTAANVLLFEADDIPHIKHGFAHHTTMPLPSLTKLISQNQKSSTVDFQHQPTHTKQGEIQRAQFSCNRKVQQKWCHLLAHTGGISLSIFNTRTTPLGLYPRSLNLKLRKQVSQSSTESSSYCNKK